MSLRRCSLPTFRSIIPILFFTAVLITAGSKLMLIKVQENSMAPTLFDGQWVIVLRGAGRIDPGDIAVFTSPLDQQLVIKRCILNSEMNPVIEHGWLITPWGRWYLTGSQWDRMDIENTQADGSLFMVGDNQFQSFDSRTYGYVPSKNLIGKVLLSGNHG
jgi:signal peptidase I